MHVIYQRYLSKGLALMVLFYLVSEYMFSFVVVVFVPVVAGIYQRLIKTTINKKSTCEHTLHTPSKVRHHSPFVYIYGLTYVCICMWVCVYINTYLFSFSCHLCYFAFTFFLCWNIYLYIYYLYIFFRNVYIFSVGMWCVSVRVPLFVVIIVLAFKDISI